MIGGAVVNAAINRYTYVAIEPRTDGHYHLESDDFGIVLDIKDRAAFQYNGELDAVKAAIKKSDNEAGLNIFIRSDVPPGSGMGSSASLCIALAGLLLKHQELPIVDAARSIEVEELHIPGGKQDQLASFYGGFNYLEFKGSTVARTAMKLDLDVLCHLEKHLILCYTGKARVSGNLIYKVMTKFSQGNQQTVQALDNILAIAREMKTTLERGNLDKFGKLLSLNWENQKLLDPSISNDDIDRIYQLALDAGALGGKALGAGGGGCLIFYTRPNKEGAVKQALYQAGVKIIDFCFEFGGLTLWSAPSQHDA
jgi:D-glycero-alpha-D-manno-heptose-7-phosphate kinase